MDAILYTKTGKLLKTVHLEHMVDPYELEWRYGDGNMRIRQFHFTGTDSTGEVLIFREG